MSMKIFIRYPYWNIITRRKLIMTTTMEQLNHITMGLNKCKPLDEIFGVFDDTNKKIKGALEEYYASKKSKEASKDINNVNEEKIFS